MAYRKFARRSYRRRFKRRARGGFRRRVRRIAFGIAEKKYLDYYFGAAERIPHVTPMPPGADIVGISANNVPASSTGFVFVSLLTMLQQGFTESTRIGSRIKLEYIQLVLNMAFIPPVTGDAGSPMRINGCQCRYIVTRVKGASGAVTSDPFAGTVFHGALGLKNPPFMRNRKTLLDRQVRMAFTSAPTQALATGTGVPLIQHYIPIRRVVQFSKVNAFNAEMFNTDNMMDNDIQFGICGGEDNVSCAAVIGVRLCYRDA